MIPKECKRLAEVDFPIAAVSAHAVREKSIRHGHPSTLHLWWARRPLASSRAMLLALLMPDPADPRCPTAFKGHARKHLARLYKVGPGDDELRRWLFRFIADFANWDTAAEATFLEVGRGLVRAAYPEGAPLVVDPFAGGGSIPLEALRLGCDAFASDLNPVACLILKVMLEDIPRHGPMLVEELRRVGAEIKRQAAQELADLYVNDPDGATPIAYLWARTVRCESPNCGAEIPLARSFWLCKKANRKRALRHRVVRTSAHTPRIEFEVFEPNSEIEVPGGTVSRARATCVCCGIVLPPGRVRPQLAAQRGGADVVFDSHGHRVGGARMLAVVTLTPGEAGRHYRLPNERDYTAVRKSQERVAMILNDWERGGKVGPCPVPDEPTPTKNTHRAVGSQIPLYGMNRFGDLFNARQKTAMVTLVRLTTALSQDSSARLPLMLALTRAANAGCSLCRWHVTGEKHEGVYSRQALPMVWDYSEGNPLSAATGGYEGALEWIARVAEGWPSSASGQAQPADAAEHPLADETAPVWFTDPPYYDAVPYADLSDFFFVWLKRALPGYPLLRDPFDAANPLTHKLREAVQCEKVKDADGHPKDRAFYEETMARAFAEGRRVLREDGVGCVVFAHTTTEGWEALLSGMIRGGWTITGSWPIATEMGARLNARDTASLATSVHLICRPRRDDATVGDWAEVLRELQARVVEWMLRLQDEGVRGADLVFACIGPALEIFSRYRRVETAEGRTVGLPEYLERVWAVVGQTALAQVLGVGIGTGSTLEEDARLTSLFLWTLQSTAPANGRNEDAKDAPEEVEPTEDEDDEEPAGRKPKGLPLQFDVVRRFAQPLGIHLPDWENRIIEIKKGVVYLLPVSARAEQLFGDAGADLFADEIERDPSRPVQLAMFEEAGRVPEVRGRARRRGRGTAITDDDLGTRREATTLDRVHAGMLLQAGGRSTALRTLLGSEREKGPDFLRLANALSALYPRSSEEKRLLDAMLLAVPR